MVSIGNMKQNEEYYNYKMKKGTKRKKIKNNPIVKIGNRAKKSLLG